MKTVQKNSSIIDQANQEDWDHIFFIVNPVSAIIAKLIIEKFRINEKNLKIYSIRETDVSLITKDKHKIDSYWHDRFFIKLGFNPLTKRVLKKIDARKRGFVAYTSWCFRESTITPSINELLKSDLARGHIYIEEGQATYRPSKPYSVEKFQKEQITHAEGLTQMYRDDAKAFICILNNAFPEVPNSKKIILNNISILKNFYKPKLLGIKSIGVTCAERRLEHHQWKGMLKKLIHSMPDGGVIKIHPSFLFDPKKRKRIFSIFNKLKTDNIEICDESVILEIEMLFEKKFLIGSLTSLDLYATSFGSEFKSIELY